MLMQEGVYFASVLVLCNRIRVLDKPTECVRIKGYLQKCAFLRDQG